MNTQMIAMFIAIFLVMGIMLYFIIVSLRIVIENASKKVNAFFLDKLKEYDEDFAEKIRDIEKLEDYRDELNKEIHELQMSQKSLQASRFFAPRPVIRDTVIPLAKYIDNDFFGDYKKTKKLMEMDKNGIIKTVQERNPYSGNIKRYEAASRMSKMLNFDALYDLVTLQTNEQLEVLRDVFQGDELNLLEEYLEETKLRESFDILHFENWIRLVSETESPVLVAFVGDEREDYTSEKNKVECRYDANICEGIKIIYQNLLYNYSIYEARKKNERIY